MNKQPEITQATHSAFITAYTRLAETRPNNRITIQQIADAAGYNRATFYRYFRDIYDVRDCLENDVICSLLERLRVPLASGAIDDMFFSIFLDVFHEKNAEIKILLREENRMSFIRKIEDALMPAALTRYNTENGQRMRCVMDIYFSGVFSAIANWIDCPADMSEKEMLALVRNLFESWFVPQIKANNTQKE